MLSRTILWVLLLATTAVASAQAWSDSYNEALRHVREQKWSEARASFQAAIASRAEDRSEPSQMPGPITQNNLWRKGLPYSANFGAAYCGFKHAISLTDDAARQALMRQVADEFQVLVTKGQHASETYYFLSQALANLRDVAKQQELQAQFKAREGKFDWKIDPEILTPEDKTAVASLAGTSSGTTVNAGSTNNTLNPSVGPAQTTDKFALLVGNSESRIESLKVPFAAQDIQYLRENLIQNAGYMDANISMVANASLAQLKKEVEALAERATPDSTIFIYFSGVGANLGGKDFLGCIDTTSATDSANMMAKMDLYSPFIKKGCKIFAFYQVNRPVVEGLFFGKEAPRFGSLSEMQSTLPGESVTSMVRDGKTIGLFTYAMSSILAEIRSNRVPVMEFGWQVFSRMRGSSAVGTSGGSSVQVPTLPVIQNMDPERTGF